MDNNAPATTSDRIVPVPDDAEFFREEVHSDRLTPISAAAAQPGDIVVRPGRRAGTYLGAGRVLLQGGEWEEFARAHDSKTGVPDVSMSLDPLTVWPPAEPNNELFDRILGAAQKSVGDTEWAALDPALQRAFVAEKILSWQHRMRDVLDGEHLVGLTTSLHARMIDLFGEA